MAVGAAALEPASDAAALDSGAAALDSAGAAALDDGAAADVAGAAADELLSLSSSPQAANPPRAARPSPAAPARWTNCRRLSRRMPPGP